MYFLKKICPLVCLGRIAAANCINYDLLVPAFDLIREKGLAVNIKWIPSHLDEEALPTNVSLCDFIGNRFADKYAKKAADQYSLPLHITAPILYHSNLIRRIQNRFAIILCNLPNRPKQPKPPKQPKTDIYHYMAISSHVAYEIGGRVRYARCRDSFSCNPREMLLK